MNDQKKIIYFLYWICLAFHLIFDFVWVRFAEGECGHKPAAETVDISDWMTKLTCTANCHIGTIWGYRQFYYSFFHRQTFAYCFRQINWLVRELKMRFTRALFWRAKDLVKDPIPDVTKDVGEMTKKFSNLPETYIKRSMRQVRPLSILVALDGDRNELKLTQNNW